MVAVHPTGHCSVCKHAASLISLHISEMDPEHDAFLSCGQNQQPARTTGAELGAMWRWCPHGEHPKRRCSGTCPRARQLMLSKDAAWDTLLQTAAVAARGQHCCFLFNKTVPPISLLRDCLGKSSCIQACPRWLGCAVLWHPQAPLRDRLASHPCRDGWPLKPLRVIQHFIFRHCTKYRF